MTSEIITSNPQTSSSFQTKNENLETETVPPPQYSAAIMTRHQEWERHVRSKQTRVKAALTAKLVQLQAAAVQDVVEIADVENQIEEAFGVIEDDIIELQQQNEETERLNSNETLKEANEL